VTDGILGEVISVIARAAVYAITSGEEAISPRVIERSGYTSPAKRRRNE
jgi:hypothetical protein